MMDIFERKLESEMVSVFIPSISMRPSMCVSRNNAAMSDDFPAAVLPTTPILEPSGISRLMFFNIGSPSGSYRNDI